MLQLLIRLTELSFYTILFVIVCMFLLVIKIILLCVFLKLCAFLIKKLSKNKFNLKELTDKKSPKFTVGFFHPFCNSGIQ